MPILCVVGAIAAFLRAAAAAPALSLDALRRAGGRRGALERRDRARHALGTPVARLGRRREQRDEGAEEMRLVEGREGDARPLLGRVRPARDEQARPVARLVGSSRQ